MKKGFILLLLVLAPKITQACSCKYGGNFLYVAKQSETIVKARVVEHIYHTENGQRFKTRDEQIQAKIYGDLDEFYGTGESMRIEILYLIRGSEKRKFIEIFSSDGSDCRATTTDFKVGQTYVMSIYQPRRTGVKLPNETLSDYAIGACSENWIQFLPETNEVFGIIKGKSQRRKIRKYSFDKLIDKLVP